jgi:hypothetical protein
VEEELHSLVDSNRDRKLLVVGMVVEDMVPEDRRILVGVDSRPWEI